MTLEKFVTSNYFLIPLFVCGMFWKGLALWTAGNRKDKIWFIILFLANTAGILEIIYPIIRKRQKKK